MAPGSNVPRSMNRDDVTRVAAFTTNVAVAVVDCNVHNHVYATPVGVTQERNDKMPCNILLSNTDTVVVGPYTTSVVWPASISRIRMQRMMIDLRNW